MDYQRDRSVKQNSQLSQYISTDEESQEMSRTESVSDAEKNANRHSLLEQLLQQDQPV